MVNSFRTGFGGLKRIQKGTELNFKLKLTLTLTLSVFATNCLVFLFFSLLFLSGSFFFFFLVFFFFFFFKLILMAIVNVSSASIISDFALLLNVLNAYLHIFLFQFRSCNVYKDYYQVYRHSS